MRLTIAGTNEEMWPTSLNSSSIGDYNCTGERKFVDPNCPSAGYHALYAHFDTRIGRNDGLDNLLVEDAQIRRKIVNRARAIGVIGETHVATPHAPSAHMQEAAAGLWSDSLMSGLRAAGSHWNRIRPSGWLAHRGKRIIFKTKSELPFVRARCFRYPEDIDTDEEQFGIEFHTLTPLGSLPGPTYPTISRLMHRDSGDGTQILKKIADVGDPTANMTLVVPLARPLPVSLTPGVLAPGLALALVRPSLRDNGTLTGNWSVSGCAIAGYWASESIVSELYPSNPTYSFEEGFGVTISEAEISAQSFSKNHFVPPNNGKWRQIDIDPTWLDLAAPQLEKSETDARYKLPKNATTLEVLLNAMWQKGSISRDSMLIQTELAIASLLVDSISRASSHRTSNYSAFLEPALSMPSSWKFKNFVRVGDPSTPIPKPSSTTPTTELSMRVFSEGYAMAITGWFDYVSVIVLLSHAAIALGFSVWLIFFHGVSSDSWETIPEMVALAQNSPPPEDEALANTCAGIRKWSTPAVMVSVELSKSQGTSAKEQLSLTFRGRPYTKGTNHVTEDTAYGIHRGA